MKLSARITITLALMALGTTACWDTYPTTQRRVESEGVVYSCETYREQYWCIQKKPMALGRLPKELCTRLCKEWP